MQSYGQIQQSRTDVVEALQAQGAWYPPTVGGFGAIADGGRFPCDGFGQHPAAFPGAREQQQIREWEVGQSFSHAGQAKLLYEREVSQNWEATVKKHVTVEKTVEVPQTIVQERRREVPKPEFVERLIEVPQVIKKEVTKQLPKTTRTVERIREVVIPKEEVRERHVKVIVEQERLFEVPKVEFRERIEYVDMFEYREVLVDKIVEVPEIEYQVREVPYYIPQEYIQEYYVDRYVEVPQVQVQELHREEQVPIRGWAKENVIPVPHPVMPAQEAQQMERCKHPAAQLSYAPAASAVPAFAPAFAPMAAKIPVAPLQQVAQTAPSAQQLQAAYASYNRVASPSPVRTGQVQVLPPAQTFLDNSTMPARFGTPPTPPHMLPVTGSLPAHLAPRGAAALPPASTFLEGVKVH